MCFRDEYVSQASHTRPSSDWRRAQLGFITKQCGVGSHPLSVDETHLELNQDLHMRPKLEIWATEQRHSQQSEKNVFAKGNTSAVLVMNHEMAPLFPVLASKHTS